MRAAGALVLLAWLTATRCLEAASCGGGGCSCASSLPLRSPPGHESLRSSTSKTLSLSETWEQGRRLKTGVLVHGCHLQAEGWREIAWGREELNELGRIPQAVLVAYHEEAAVVLFGTGGSKSEDGVLEGEVTMQFMFENFERLKNFKQFQDIDLGRLRERMAEICKVETKSLNTLQELEMCGEIMHNQQVQKIILVSSPTHLPRCIRDAKKVFDGSKFSFANAIFACPSDTCYMNSTVEDVAIVEPPHRGDREKEFDRWPLYKYLNKFFKVPRDTKLKVLQAISSLLT